MLFIFMANITDLLKAPEPLPEEKTPKFFRLGPILLVVFIVVWMVGSNLYLNHQVSSVKPQPIVVLDSAGGINLFSNLFRIGNTNFQFKTASKISVPRYEIKDKYSYGDVVVIKYFYIEAVVLDKTQPSGDVYTVLYKNHNHDLQKIALPRTMLMMPSDGIVNPAALLVE